MWRHPVGNRRFLIQQYCHKRVVQYRFLCVDIACFIVRNHVAAVRKSIAEVAVVARIVRKF